MNVRITDNTERNAGTKLSEAANMEGEYDE